MGQGDTGRGSPMVNTFGLEPQIIRALECQGRQVGRLLGGLGAPSPVKCGNSAHGVPARHGATWLTGGLFFQRSQGQLLFPSLTYPVNNSEQFPLGFFLAERGPVPKPQGDHARAASRGFHNPRMGPLHSLQPQPWPEAARSCRPSGSRGRALLSHQDGVKP